MKINNFLLVADTMIIASAILVNAPLFAGAFVYFTGTLVFDNIKQGRLKKDLEFDSWFAHHENDLDEKLQVGTNLYERLSSLSKEIITRDGHLTLNNIEEFSKRDLRLIKKTISKEILKQRQTRKKVFKK